MRITCTYEREWNPLKQVSSHPLTTHYIIISANGEKGKRMNQRKCTGEAFLPSLLPLFSLRTWIVVSCEVQEVLSPFPPSFSLGIFTQTPKSKANKNNFSLFLSLLFFTMLSHLRPHIFSHPFYHHHDFFMFTFLVCIQVVPFRTRFETHNYTTIKHPPPTPAIFDWNILNCKIDKEKKTVTLTDDLLNTTQK